MNCQEFQNLVIDLARGAERLVSAEVRETGRRHAETCVSCAARLTGETALQAGFRAIARSDEELRAPFHLEANLLVAFRAQRETEVAPVRVPSRSRWFAWRWAFATAGLIALLSLGWGQFRQVPTSPVTQATQSPTPAPALIPVPPAPEPPPSAAPPDVRTWQASNRGKTPRRPVGNTSPVRLDQVTIDVGPFEVQESEPPSIKDFVVFDYAENMAPPEAVQMMRVRMPRSKLAPLGISPPRETRSAEYVNADLLVGNDGTPRAIRLTKY